MTVSGNRDWVRVWDNKGRLQRLGKRMGSHGVVKKTGEDGMTVEVGGMTATMLIWANNAGSQTGLSTR